MPVDLSTPEADQLPAVLETLASWQLDGLPDQRHPGDLGWQWRFGPDVVAEGLRVWRVDGIPLALGTVDQGELIRMAVAPSADHDEELATRIVRDLQDPSRGVLTAARVAVEARFGTALRARLRSRGWVDDEPWTPLVRDLRDPVPDSGLRVEVVHPGRVDDRVAVQRASFDNSTFDAERWHEMSRSATYRMARCLVGYDGHDEPVAAVTVWSAGAGRPGLLEPLGVHRDHRGHGYGTAISLAAAAALQEMGSWSSIVATPAANLGGVATYESAGYRRMPDVTDFAYHH